VFAAFTGIAGLLTLTNGLALYETRKVQGDVRDIMENALASVELVNRMGHDVDHERLLIEAHIFERESLAMERVEAQLAVLQADYAAAARAYEPLAVFPGEARAWRQLQDDVGALRGPLAETLALSRRNQDAEARAALVALESQFAVIDREEAHLIDINQQAAAGAQARVRRLQRSSTVLFAVLALLGAALSVAVGLWVTRLVRQREDESRGYAALLETRNHELDAFAGRVAHDLRGPLTTINLAASVLTQRAPAAGDTVAILRRGVVRMESLSQDLLALSRLAAEAPAGVADPSLVTSQLREELAARPDAEQVTLRVAVEPAQVHCAEGLLRQVLANLADNALKYRREGGGALVEISGGVVGQGYELRVADNGIGMSCDEARQAFDPFFRALRVRETPGTGLGLSIVKRVVEASGGTIAVESQPDAGTTFVIRLALARAEAAAGGPRPTAARAP
jgi:signal transduction histidine kinase